MKLDRKEFACKCCGVNHINEEFLAEMSMARDLSHFPFVINSGYRCVKHNAEVGGVDGSSHVMGVAADIACPDNEHRLEILRALIIVGFTRFGIGKNFIHVDNDRSKPRKRMWLY